MVVIRLAELGDLPLEPLDLGMLLAGQLVDWNWAVRGPAELDLACRAPGVRVGRVFARLVWTRLG